MEAPLSICTKEEMRGMIRFLFAEGVKPVEIIRRMQAQYGDNLRVDRSLQNGKNFCMR
jgi:cytochrome c-type biogenesis protein CcmH/NrfF